MRGLERSIQAQIESPCVKRLRAYQYPAEFAHGAFLPVRALTVEQESGREIQQRVAEEFETLIIAGGAK